VDEAVDLGLERRDGLGQRLLLQELLERQVIALDLALGLGGRVQLVSATSR